MIPILRNVFTKYTFLLLLLSACIGVQVSFAQVTFSVVCPQTEIGKEDLLEIEFKVSNAEYIESIIPPDFKNFSIVSGPNLQRGMNSMNGKTDTYVSISFMLKPLKPGTYKIGLARAKADGKEYSTKPVTIKISKESNSNPSVDPGNNSPFSGFGNNMPLSRPSTRLNENILQPGENAEEKLKHNIFLKLDVNKTACYVGEPITAAFKVYTRLNSQTNVIDMPSFNGFSVSEMDFNRDMQIEEYNGRKYNVYTLRKVQLYPMQEGNIVLTPLVANNRAIFFTADYAKKQQQE